MNASEVPALVLRGVDGPVVAHQILRIPAGYASTASRLLAQLDPSFGVQGPNANCCSLGFSFAGLDALGVPQAYMRLFRRLAPAFEQGAVRRSVRTGDGGQNGAARWRPEFRESYAHVLLSWHGGAGWVIGNARRFARQWRAEFCCKTQSVRFGRRLAAPNNETGHWVHFGYRDGISDVCIDAELPPPKADDLRHHAPGELVLGSIDDSGCNPFVLSRAPEKVRAFFRDSSFGVLHPMHQDLAAFEAQVDRWQGELGRVYPGGVTREFVKAKLCGRWPNGQQIRSGDLAPRGTLTLDLRHDAQGEGCPFGSHVRRMQPAPNGNGFTLPRPLQRRSFPFGPADWSGRPKDRRARGLIGHFFCASIERQFEHLTGQWAARPPVGFAADDRALDPFFGPHVDAEAALSVPLKNQQTQSLASFHACTTTQGTLYAWHPSRCALSALLRDDFVPEEDEIPWL